MTVPASTAGGTAVRLLCPVNVSEGRDGTALAALCAAAGDDLLDLHTDAHHHRSVLTLADDAAPRRVARVAVTHLNLAGHDGVHPRVGVLDVVPFVPLAGSTLTEALAARDAFGAWLAAELGVPGFAYGPERSLPQVRRTAFTALAPTWGPLAPHPTAGATCVGARGPLVAYNVWLAEPDVALARRVAAAVRGDGIRALGLDVGGRAQVSMNLVEPERTGPATAYDRVAALAAVSGAELVGLVSEAVLYAVPEERWAQLDLAADRSVEARLARRRAGQGWRPPGGRRSGGGGAA